MIEKDTRSPRIQHLKIMHLFETDYSLLLKIMWGSQLVRRSVNLNLLNDGQHDSVQGTTVMDPVMLNQLTMDSCHLLVKINYAPLDNDATACFLDRIIVAFGLLAAWHYGVPMDVVCTHETKSLELMKYMIMKLNMEFQKTLTAGRLWNLSSVQDNTAEHQLRFGYLWWYYCLRL